MSSVSFRGRSSPPRAIEKMHTELRWLPVGGYEIVDVQRLKTGTEIVASKIHPDTGRPIVLSAIPLDFRSRL